MAGIGADDLGFIEAHGTGTVLGDPIEIGALTRVPRSATDAVGSCALGSIKSNIGHLARRGCRRHRQDRAGARARRDPAGLHFETPEPGHRFRHQSIQREHRAAAWSGRPAAAPGRRQLLRRRRHQRACHPRGGASGWLRPSGRAWHILPLSAKAETALPEVAVRMRDHLRRSSVAFADSVSTAQTARRAFDHRRVVIAADAADAAVALDSESGPRSFARKVPPTPPRVAFMFTGQGSPNIPGWGPISTGTSRPSRRPWTAAWRCSSRRSPRT